MHNLPNFLTSLPYLVLVGAAAGGWLAQAGKARPRPWTWLAG